jgi:hypothetical protein
VRAVGEAEVDWAAGTITARGGAAADFRMPSANVARPGAERRARAAALAKLRATVETLAGKGKLTPAQLDAALARASAASVDYQSNGGVLLALRLAFADLAARPGPAAPRKDAGAGAEPARPAPAQVLSVAAMPLELAPRLVAGDREAALSFAVYRVGSPPAGADAVAVRRDQKGRLVLPKGAPALQKLAGAPALIYVEKVSR